MSLQMKTFRIGGVHPAENKLSAAEPIKVAALPKVAVFPMSQHIGLQLPCPFFAFFQDGFSTGH